MLGCDKTVTLYHRTYDPASRTDLWDRTVYAAAIWYGAQAATVSDNGAADRRCLHGAHCYQRRDRRRPR